MEKNNLNLTLDGLQSNVTVDKQKHKTYACIFFSLIYKVFLKTFLVFLKIETFCSFKTYTF